MKVLHLNHWYGAIGGAETYLHALCQALQRRGIASAVVHGRQEGAGFTAPVPSYLIAGADVYRQGDLETAWRQLQDVLRTEHPDLVLVHGWSNWALLERLLPLMPVSQFVHTFTPVCPGAKMFRFPGPRSCGKALGPGCLANAYLRRCANPRPQRLLSDYVNALRLLTTLRRLEHVAVASRYMQGVMVQNGIAPDRLLVAPYFTPPSDAPSSPPSDEASLLFVGRLSDTKGPGSLLSALRHVQDPWRLAIVGDGWYRARAEDLARRWSLAGSVRFEGAVAAQRVACYYRHTAIVIMPSLWPEPFGIVGLEAMACGRPVVAYDGGGTAEWLDHDETGILVPAGDERALATALSELLRNPSRGRQMGARGRERVRERFTEERHVQALAPLWP